MARKKKDEAPPEADERGEVTLPLEGQTYHVRPSRQAVMNCERQLGRSLHELTEQAGRNALSLADMGVIAAEMMRAYAASHPEAELRTDHAGAKPERLSEMIFEAGPLKIQLRLLVPLFAALTGGVDAQGEMKPATGSQPPFAG